MTIKYPLLLLIQGGAMSLSPYNLLFGLISLVKSAGYLIFWVMIIRALMSWVPGRSPIDYVMYQLTEPLMAPIRRIIPAMGGIDFSAMVVILILYLINYRAWICSVRSGSCCECSHSCAGRAGDQAIYSAESQPRPNYRLAWRRTESRHHRPRRSTAKPRPFDQVYRQAVQSGEKQRHHRERRTGAA